MDTNILCNYIHMNVEFSIQMGKDSIEYEEHHWIYLLYWHFDLDDRIHFSDVIDIQVWYFSKEWFQAFCSICRHGNVHEHGGNGSGQGSMNQETEKKKPHIKKPLNAFMLFMKEQRASVVAECTLKESAAINQILGRKVRFVFFLHSYPKAISPNFSLYVHPVQESHGTWQSYIICICK